MTCATVTVWLPADKVAEIRAMAWLEGRREEELLEQAWHEWCDRFTARTWPG